MAVSFSKVLTAPYRRFVPNSRSTVSSCSCSPAQRRPIVAQSSSFALSCQADSTNFFSGSFGRKSFLKPANSRVISVKNSVTMSTETKYSEELEKGCQAVALASQLCQRVQRQLEGSEKQDKSDDSPVTVADYGAQAVVAWSLQRAFPESPLQMVAEEDSTSLTGAENAAILGRITELVNDIIQTQDPECKLTEEEVIQLIDLGASPGGPSGRHWVLDPIDGTRGFVGGRQYAVCLGLIDQGEVVVGVLGCPNMPLTPLTPEDGTSEGCQDDSERGVCFAAQQGGGAFFGPLKGLKLPPSQPMKLSGGEGETGVNLCFMESYESRHSQHGLTANVAKELGITNPPLRLDSQCKYGALARGDAGVYMRFPPIGYREKIWDHAAGVVIVTEAGGKVSDALGDKLDFSKGRWLDLGGGGILGSSMEFHDKLVQAVAKATVQA